MPINIPHNTAATNNVAFSSTEETRFSLKRLWGKVFTSIKNTNTPPPKTIIPVDPFAGIKSFIQLPEEILNKSECSIRTISDNEKQISYSWTEETPTYLPQGEDEVNGDNKLCDSFNKDLECNKYPNNNDSECDKPPKKGRMDYFLELTGKHPAPIESDINFKELVGDENALKISQIAHQGHCAKGVTHLHLLPRTPPYALVQNSSRGSIYIKQIDRDNYTITSRFTLYLKNPDTEELVPDLQLSGERVTHLQTNKEQQEPDIIRLTISHKQPAETLLLPEMHLPE